MSSPHLIIDLRSKDQEVCKVLLPPIPPGLSTEQVVELIKKFWPRGCELDGKAIGEFAEEISNCPASDRRMVAGAVDGGAERELRNSNDEIRRLSRQVEALEQQLPRGREQRRQILDQERELRTERQQLAKAKADNAQLLEEADRLRKSLKALKDGLRRLLVNEERGAVPRTELRPLIEEAEKDLGR